ncbi:MAG: hypothetical protein ACAI44_06000 [Candidatus Sericytochromatia bacterium]
MQARDQFEAAGWLLLGFLRQQQMHTLETLLEQSVLETVKVFLRQSGFVHHPAGGEEEYDFNSLSQLSALALQTVAKKLPDRAASLHFALRIRGATLSDPAQRQAYIRESLLSSEASAADHLFEMNYFLQYDPEHTTVIQALTESIRLSSEAQILAFLQASGFISPNLNKREGGSLIHEDALKHLPAEQIQLLLLGLGDNPDPLSWGHYFPSHAVVVKPLRRLLS